jgi:hypothetical protein
MRPRRPWTARTPSTSTAWTLPPSQQDEWNQRVHVLTSQCVEGEAQQYVGPGSVESRNGTAWPSAVQGITDNPQ